MDRHASGRIRETVTLRRSSHRPQTPRAAAYREDANFASQWGLEAIRAHWAYAHLETLEGEDAEPGSGVTIGFVDTGIDRQHPIFAGKTITEEFLLGASDETATGFEIGDFSHGTAVASIAAGRPVGTGGAPQGVAWSADIAMFAIQLGTAGSRLRPHIARGPCRRRRRVGGTGRRRSRFRWPSRYRESESRLRGHHRQLQRARSSHQFRTDDRRARPDRLPPRRPSSCGRRATHMDDPA